MTPATAAEEMMRVAAIMAAAFRQELDDFHTIVNNAYIRYMHNMPLFFKDGSTSSILPANQSYRPVVTASLAIDYWLGGGYNVVFFHITNFLLFLLQGIGMVYLPMSHARIGTEIELEIRGQKFPAIIEKKPLYKKSTS